MTLKAIFTDKNDIPEALREYYEERNGVFHLAKIEGMKTEADVERVQAVAKKEREERARIEREFKSVLGDRKPDEVLALLDRIPELEAAAQGALKGADLENAVETRLKTRLAPKEREAAQLAAELLEARTKLQTFEQREQKRIIADKVRAACIKAKVLESAQEDALLRAETAFEINSEGQVTVKDGGGPTAGVPPDVWLAEIAPSRPHWWAPSQGGGASGSRQGGGIAKNPWSKDHWNISEQMQLVREHGQEKAAQYAAAVGSHLGAVRPKG